MIIISDRSMRRQGFHSVALTLFPMGYISKDIYPVRKQLIVGRGDGELRLEHMV